MHALSCKACWWFVVGLLCNIGMIVVNTRWPTRHAFSCNACWWFVVGYYVHVMFTSFIIRNGLSQPLRLFAPLLTERPHHYKQHFILSPPRYQHGHTNTVYLLIALPSCSQTGHTDTDLSIPLPPLSSTATPTQSMISTLCCSTVRPHQHSK